MPASLPPQSPQGQAPAPGGAAPQSAQSLPPDQAMKLIEMGFQSLQKAVSGGQGLDSDDVQAFQNAQDAFGAFADRMNQPEGQEQGQQAQGPGAPMPENASEGAKPAMDY